MNGTQAKRTRGTMWRWAATAVLLGLVGVVVQQVAFSGASSSLVTRNPGNTQSAGMLLFSSTKDGQVIVAATNLRPGQSQNGTVTLTGAGDYSGAYTLSRTALVDTPSSPAFSATLTLKVEDITGTASTLYNSTLGAFTSVSLGTIAIGAHRDYRLTLTYPTAGANPALQNATSSATLAFIAVAQ